MIIKASAALRNDYTTISNLAKETKEPIYITKNGEGDMVLMSIDAFEKREQMLKLRAKVLQAEEERINGAKTMSISEARKKLNIRNCFIKQKRLIARCSMVTCRRAISLYIFFTFSSQSPLPAGAGLQITHRQLAR